VIHFPQRANELQEKKNDLSGQIALIPDRETYLEAVLNAISDKQQVVNLVDKNIETDISLAEALAYLNQIQYRNSSFMFNLEFVKEVKSNGFGYKIFSLKGEGIYPSVLYMVWLLEKGEKLFSIESMNMHGVETQRTEEQQQIKGVPYITVQFEMTVKAMYASEEYIPAQQIVSTNVEYPEWVNPFYPLITRTLSPNTEGLIEIESCELRAILPGKVLVSDSKGGMHGLKKGDEVYLGHLSKINHSKNIVEFTLNKGGIIEKFNLHLPLQDLTMDNQ